MTTMKEQSTIEKERKNLDQGLVISDDDEIISLQATARASPSMAA